MRKINGVMEYTKVEKFGFIKTILENNPGITENMEISTDTLIEFVNAEIVLLENKSAKRSTSKSQQKITDENNKILLMACDYLNTIDRATVTEILDKSVELTEYTTVDGKKISNQKLSAVLRNGITQGIIKKEIEKKTSYFSMA